LEQKDREILKQRRQMIERDELLLAKDRLLYRYANKKKRMDFFPTHIPILMIHLPKELGSLLDLLLDFILFFSFPLYFGVYPLAQFVKRGIILQYFNYSMKFSITMFTKFLL